MKSTGIVRKIDELGRITIPIELRRMLDAKERDPLEIFTDGDRVVLQKYKPDMTCAITGEVGPENQKFGNGQIVLSPKGAEIVLEDIKRKFSQQKG